MWPWTAAHQYQPAWSQDIDQVRLGKPLRKGVWAEPGWRATTAAGAVLLAFCLGANVIVLIWASITASIPGAPAADDNPVIFVGSCSSASSVKTWSHLVINIVSTLILATSTTCMQCLSAPTRAEVDEAHRRGRWIDVGILSTRNLGFIDRKRIILYLILGLTSLPLHLFYNSVIFTTLGTYDSLTILTSSDFNSSGSSNASLVSSLYNYLDNSTTTRNYQKSTVPYYLEPPDDYSGVFDGTNPWSSGAITAPGGLPPLEDVQAVISGLKSFTQPNGSSAQDCIKAFGSAPLTQYHNIALVTSKTSNVSGDIFGMQFLLAPGQDHWTCNDPGWMYNGSDLFFARCDLTRANWQPGPDSGDLPRGSIAMNITDPIPSGYWSVDSCYYDEAKEQCTVVFAKWLMLVVVLANVVKLATMIYTVKYLDFQPCITVGDMVASYLRRPDHHTTGIGPHSNLSIKQAYRYEISRIYSLEHPGIKNLIGPKAYRHELNMHAQTWESKRQSWRNAASVRRWSATVGVWSLGLAFGTAFIAVAGAGDWTQAWSQGLGSIAPDFVIPEASSAGQTLLAQTVLANTPQIVLSILYVFYSGLMSTMLSARELAQFATGAKPIRVSPPKRGVQKSSYFLQIPYKFALPLLSAMILLHWLISQSVFLVRLDEYKITGEIKHASFESVLGYSLRGILAATITGFGILLFPIILSFFRFPSGAPLIGHNSVAISIACHPFPDEPEHATEKLVRYGRVFGVDENGNKRSRIGFSAGQVEPLVGGEKLDDTRCLSTFLFMEQGLEHTCTLDRNSWNMFVRIMKGRVKMP